jgi:hypothetical protein
MRVINERQLVDVNVCIEEVLKLLLNGRWFLPSVQTRVTSAEPFEAPKPARWRSEPDVPSFGTFGLL